MIEEIRNLRTYESQESIIDLFERAISSLEQGAISKAELIECFYELSDQQYHQYALLPESICQKIEEWVEKSLDFNKRLDAELLIPLSYCLGFHAVRVENYLNIIPFSDLTEELEVSLKNTTEGRINPYWDYSN